MTLTAIKYIRALSSLDMPVEVVEDALEIYSSAPELKEVLENPVVYKEEKYAVIDRIFSKEVSNLLKILCEYSDMGYFEEIAANYRAYMNEQKNTLNVTMRYVTPPSEKQLEQIEGFLRSKYEVGSIAMEQVQDKSLIGGFILNVRGSEYDWSLRGRMQELQSSLTGGEADGRN